MSAMEFADLIVLNEAVTGLETLRPSASAAQMHPGLLPTSFDEARRAARVAPTAAPDLDHCAPQ